MRLASYWLQQVGFGSNHLFLLGRRIILDMAETGSGGPCPKFILIYVQVMDPVAVETLDTDRFVELWNLVFIQYNRINPDLLDLLPATHVDTGMGLDRIVSVLQGVDSNYKNDLFAPIIESLRALTGHTIDQVYADLLPIVSLLTMLGSLLLIADGVVPGNIGRNYICRMIISPRGLFWYKAWINRTIPCKSSNCGNQEF